MQYNACSPHRLGRSADRIGRSPRNKYLSNNKPTITTMKTKTIILIILIVFTLQVAGQEKVNKHDLQLGSGISLPGSEYMTTFNYKDETNKKLMAFTEQLQELSFSELVNIKSVKTLIDLPNLDIDKFEELIKAGANVNLANKYNETPLSCALKMHYISTLELYMYWAQNKNKGSIFSNEALVNMGAYENAENQEFLNEGMYKLGQNRKRIGSLIKLIVKNGANVEWINSEGKTLLVQVLESNLYNEIRIILNCGASIESANSHFTYLSTSKETKEILESRGAIFTIRDEKYHLKEPFKVELGWTILGIGDFYMNIGENETLYIPLEEPERPRPSPSIALRTGLNISITPAYKFKINNEIFFVYKGVGNYDIMDIVYSPTLQYYFAPGDYYFSSGVEYNYNLSCKLVKNSESTEVFGVNKSTWSPCIGIGMNKKKIKLELRYKKDLSNYYTHYHKNQSSFYLLFGIKF